MARILLGVTGSVAALRTPELFFRLCRAGHEVKVVATATSLYFFDPSEMPGGNSAEGAVSATVICDADEFPGREVGRRWERGESVLHIELRKWAELLVIAPLDAHTLAKMAGGLCDNTLTCVWRAWDLSRPVVLAPAMNTLMWEHPLTQRHWRQLAELFVSNGVGQFHRNTPWEELRQLLQANSSLRVIGPISKQLACGDVGLGGMAEVDEIVQVIEAAIAK